MKTQIITILFLFFLTGAFAQVEYTKVSPVKTINTFDSINIHPAKPINTYPFSVDSVLMIWFYKPTSGPGSPEVGINVHSPGNMEVLTLAKSPFPNGAAVINFNDSISATSGVWKKPNLERINISAIGNWINKIDSFMGVRFKRNGKWHYGWIKMSVDNTPSYVTISGYAYQQTPDKMIKAGDTTKAAGIFYFETKKTYSYTSQNKVLSIKGLSGEYMLSVTDLSGRLVFKAEKYNDYSVNLSALPSDVYVITITTKENTQSDKLFLQ